MIFQKYFCLPLRKCQYMEELKFLQYISLVVVLVVMFSYLILKPMKLLYILLIYFSEMPIFLNFFKKIPASEHFVEKY